MQFSIRRGTIGAVMRHRLCLRSLASSLLGLSLLFTTPSCESRSHPAERGVAKPTVRELRDDELPRLGALVREILAGRSVDSPEIGAGSVAVYVALRVKGSLVGEGWGEKSSLTASLKGALAKARGVAGESGSHSKKIDGVEIDVTFDYKDVDSKRTGREFSNILSGVVGIEFHHEGAVLRRAPTQTIAANRNLQGEIRAFQELHRLKKEGFREQVKVRKFSAYQYLVVLDGGEPTVHRMERGNTYVAPQEVSSSSTHKLAELASNWLVRQVAEDGRMLYNFDPAQDAEASDAGGSDNNMIRQWMATVALERVAEARNDPKIWDKVEKNIDFNLAHYYKKIGDGHGVIEYKSRGKKLGAMALAAMALVIHPKREKWAVYEQGLTNAIDSMWSEDGYLNTHYGSPRNEKNNNQNFYPGECLLLWATMMDKQEDPVRLEKFMKSFRRYRRWHLEPVHRKPSFIPWHTQANHMVWKITKDPELQAFNFRMNDWLLDMQQWDDLPFRDTKGRFYDPKRHRAQKDDAGRITRPMFGGPHASATGVYLESLIDVYRMARAVGDKNRAERYRLAMVRGLRSVMQLQYVDAVDMFYVRSRDAVLGGMRTTVYRNEIRVDNVQHNLMAILKILESLQPEDYSTESQN